SCLPSCSRSFSRSSHQGWHGDLAHVRGRDAVADTDRIAGRRHLLVADPAQPPDLGSGPHGGSHREHAQPSRPLRHPDEADRVLHDPWTGLHPLRGLQPVREFPADDAVRGAARLAPRDRSEVPPGHRRAGSRDARPVRAHRSRVGAGVARRARARARLFLPSAPGRGVGQRRDRLARHVRADPVLGRLDDSARAADPRMGRTAAERGGLATPGLLGFWHRRACDRRVRALRRHRSAGLRHRDAAQAGALPPHSARGQHRDDHRGRNAAAALSAAVSPLGIAGSVLSLFTGGLSAALVAGVCATLSDRAQSRSLLVLSGLAPRMPNLAWLFTIAALALLGIPILASFPAELMTFFGAFKNQPIGAFAVAGGLALTAISLAVLLRRVLFGAPNPEAPGVSDSSLSETWYLGLLAGRFSWFRAGSRAYLPPVTAIVVLIALGVELWAGATLATYFDGALVQDRFALFAKAAALLTAAVAVAATDWTAEDSLHLGLAMPLLAAFGIMVASSAGDLVGLWAGLELAAAAAVVLVSLRRPDLGLRLLIVGGIASALILV